MPTKATSRGSQYRCQLLTGEARPRVATRLTSLAQPSGARVHHDDHWMPVGAAAPQQARLDQDLGFVARDVQDELRCWWLVFRRGANTPNWDIASTCLIEERKGLLLVEAKAHDRELSTAGKSPPPTPHGRANDQNIRDAIQQANAGLNRVLPGWHLAADHHYPLCNRLAWAWKLANLDVPVVLVYLGFLNASDVRDEGQPFGTAQLWEDCLRRHVQGIVPEAAWSSRLDVNGTPLWLLVRSLSEQELG
jgi:hypothetical protein